MWVFLHGFLGDKRDWSPLFSHLPSSITRCAIDLPGHGKTPIGEELICQISPFSENLAGLVGYSAGGRLALRLQATFPDIIKRVIAISAHPGLNSEKEREERLASDLTWITLLKEKTLPLFLQLWYKQPIFASLTSHPRFKTLLKRRASLDPEQLIQFLERYGLGRFPPYSPSLTHSFMYGESDLKYAKLYRTLIPTSPIYGVKGAGHAAHLENPKECAYIIKKVIDGYHAGDR